MSRSSSPPAGRGSRPKPDGRYHHGNLRHALVEAAAQLLQEEGVERLTLRGVARRAGVSHTAPYHHFADRRALIAALAAAGFRDLRQAMVDRMAAPQESPARRLQATGMAAILFAARKPDHYRLMFGPVLADRSGYPDLEKAAREAFEVIVMGLREADVTTDREDSARKIGIAAWAMVHGLAMLVVDGQLGLASTEEVERIAKEATDLLWVGLGTSGR